ncbi:MAG: hypothetical protein OER88_07670, partial [Planctomycetota bacterium]|nr:hypothetical protein [Planctomycetota bacterium]
NQYIWRRRIQQYGPRLSKPYPFYDWVDAARTDLRARGVAVPELSVEPSGAELAEPARRWIGAEPDANPDPGGRVHRDANAVRTEIVVVPGVAGDDRVDRVHLEFRPRSGSDMHWNHEVDGLRVWWDTPDGVEVSGTGFDPPRSDVAVSEEPRRIEFEVRRSPKAPSQLRGFALYYVCEGTRGACLYRRQDLVVDLGD